MATGYCEILRRRHLLRMGASELVQTTYAGNRASDGGLIRVRDVVARKPDACIFEPLVEDPNRGSNASRAEILHVYSSLADAGILPIALFLPDPVHRSPKIWPAYPMHREICDEAGIPVIEIVLEDGLELEGNFVSVHTLKPGALIHARRIADAIADIRSRKPSVRSIARSLKSKKSSLCMREVNFPDHQALRSFTLNIDAEKPAGLRIILQQTIGPHSPVLKINLTGQQPAHCSLWDPFCHYERPSYASLYDGNVEAGRSSLTLSCDAEEPNYANARRTRDTWPDAESRYMKPLGPLFLVSDKPLTANLVTVTPFTPNREVVGDVLPECRQ